MKGSKEKIAEKIDKAGDIKDSITYKVSDIKDSTEENVAIAKELVRYQGNNMKSKCQFLKKVFQREDIVFMKTDAELEYWVIWGEMKNSWN